MDRSLGALALLVAASVIGIGKIAFVIGAIFIGIVAIIAFVLYVIDSDKEIKSISQYASNIDPKIQPKLLNSRHVLINEWTKSQNRRTPELGGIDWEWINYNDPNTIRFKFSKEQITYIGKVFFAEEGHPECHDQERVLRIESKIEGTDVEKIWEGTEMKRVPISSIQKNIQNSLKNDKGLRKILEEAFDQCLSNGEAFFDLDDINLDFSDNRVKREFTKACLKTCSFSSMHILADGHRVKVFIGDKDPI